MGLSRSSLAQVGVGMLSQRKENHLGLEKLVLMARDWSMDLQFEGTAWKGHGMLEYQELRRMWLEGTRLGEVVQSG